MSSRMKLRSSTETCADCSATGKLHPKTKTKFVGGHRQVTYCDSTSLSVPDFGPDNYVVRS